MLVSTGEEDFAGTEMHVDLSTSLKLLSTKIKVIFIICNYNYTVHEFIYVHKDVKIYEEHILFHNAMSFDDPQSFYLYRTAPYFVSNFAILR